jgi:protocatechuate 3,4-dioxygenase beta subunit
MNRRTGVGVAVAVMVGIGLLGLRGLRCRGEPSSNTPHTNDSRGSVSTLTARTRVDPTKLPRGSISGMIHDEAGAPIARANVCANATDQRLSAPLRALRCAATDERGRYKIAELVAASYAVHVSARQFRPVPYYPMPGTDHHRFPLAPGEDKTGVDIEMKRGGAEISGTVSDASGGPVAHAQVELSRQGPSHFVATTDTDEQGRFSGWVERGPMTLEARADGYAPSEQEGRAPGRYEIVLTPASSIAGRVVDAATGEPVAGAHVELVTERYGRFPASDSTDAQGAFRVEQLLPGRYTAAATTDGGYGRSEGSFLVGLGQQLEGTVVRLFPARRVTGKVVIAGTGGRCPEGSVTLREVGHPDDEVEATERDGWWVADSVRPGTYQPSVFCTGYAQRAPYAQIVVGNEDVTGLQWEVDPGARIRGKVVSRSGEALDGVEILVHPVGGDGMSTAAAHSRRDGRYEASGLKPGTYRLSVQSDRGSEPPEAYSVTVAEGATVERDLVLDDTGTLTGTVVDSAGGPVPDVRVFASGSAQSMFSKDARSDLDGAFTLDGMPPGTYRISSPRDLGVHVRALRPGENLGRDQLATVEARQTANVRVVMEATTGMIQGTVVDAAGAPVSDAYVACARELDGPGGASSEVARTREDWSGRNKSVLTATDGHFQLTRLAIGSYTVRAYRKGGGEAIAEHVAVGSTPRLQIASTGSIAGTARRKAGAPPPYLRISLRDAKTHYTRSEDFYMSAGHFVVRELPAGHFVLEASADDSRASTTLDLGPGENKAGADLELAALVVLTGRIVEHGTSKPVPGMRVFAAPVRSSAEFVSIEGENPESVTDDAGRFTVRRAPVGEVWIRAYATHMESGDSRRLDEVRQVSGTGTIELGDFRLVSPRIKRGEPIGVLGLQFESQPADVPLDQRGFKIRSIDPAGPAANTALQVGDVITTCDGVDVTGVRSLTWWALTQAPPGTKLTLGTQRGVTATVVLAPR